jgi:hypothetical protein
MLNACTASVERRPDCGVGRVKGGRPWAPGNVFLIPLSAKSAIAPALTSPHPRARRAAALKAGPRSFLLICGAGLSVYNGHHG